MLAFPCLGVPCIFRLSRIRTTGQVSIGIAGQIRYGFSSGQNPCLRCGGQIFVLLIPVVQVPGRLPEPDIHFIQHAGFDLLPLSKGHFHERHADAVVELFRTVHLSSILFAGKAEFYKGIFHFVQVCICIEGKDDLIKLSRLQVDPLQAVRLLLFFRLVKIFFISSKGFSITFQRLFVCRYGFACGHFFILRCLYRHIGKISVLVFDIPPAKPQFTICNRLVRIILQIQGKLGLVSRHYLIIICNNVDIYILRFSVSVFCIACGCPPAASLFPSGIAFGCKGCISIAERHGPAKDNGSRQHKRQNSADPSLYCAVTSVYSPGPAAFCPSAFSPFRILHSASAIHTVLLLTSLP